MAGPRHGLWGWLVPPNVPWAQGVLTPRTRASNPEAAGADPAPAPDAPKPQWLPSPAAPLSAAPAPHRDSQGLLWPDSVPPAPSEPRCVKPAPASKTPPDAANSLIAHPQAQQRIVLGTHVVAYRLQRSRRRSIGFSIGVQGLAVNAPAWVALADIEQALHAKSAWVVRKLQEMQQRQSEQDAARTHWGHGGQLPYLGQPLLLSLQTPSSAPAQRKQLPQRDIAPDGSQRLSLPLEQGCAPAQVRAMVQAWMLREARSLFTARLMHFAPQLQVQWNALRLTSARTRWGSANSQGVIRLNWRLMQHSPEVIDYVVVHELSHLRHMDHSAQFWATVASVLPHWQAQRQTLRDQVLPAWD